MTDKQFKDVDKQSVALMGEMYGKIAGLIPFYSDERFFVFITIDQYVAFENGSPIRFKDGHDMLFKCQWSEGQKPYEVVSDAFIEYIHSLNPDNPIEMEQSTMQHLMQFVMSCESIVSKVLDQLNDRTKIVGGEAPKLVLPKSMH